MASTWIDDLGCIRGQLSQQVVRVGGIDLGLRRQQRRQHGGVRLVRGEEADQLLVERLRHLRLARSDVLRAAAGRSAEAT